MNPDGEPAPSPRARALRDNRPAVHLDETLDEREPDAEAAFRSRERTFTLHEEVEDAFDEVGRHADSRILDDENGHLARHVDGDRDRAAVGRVLHRVGHQVHDDLFQAHRIEATCRA